MRLLLMNQLKKYPYITISLILANCIIFVIESLNGGTEDLDTAIRFGAIYTPYVLDNGEWYRLFISMFLHFGIEHLGRNMLSLFAVGPYVEHYYGKIRFLLIYIISGIGGGLAVIFCDYFLQSEYYAVTAGASGAIFGLFAVIILFAFLPRFRRVFPMKRVIIALVLMLLPGLLDNSISQAGHLGGLIAGFISALIFLLFDPKIALKQP